MLICSTVISSAVNKAVVKKDDPRTKWKKLNRVHPRPYQALPSVSSQWSSCTPPAPGQRRRRKGSWRMESCTQRRCAGIPAEWYLSKRLPPVSRDRSRRTSKHPACGGPRPTWHPPAGERSARRLCCPPFDSLWSVRRWRNWSVEGYHQSTTESINQSITLMPLSIKIA